MAKDRKKKSRVTVTYFVFWPRSMNNVDYGDLSDIQVICYTFYSLAGTKSEINSTGSVHMLLF